MKAFFDDAELEIIAFEANDVITTSGGCDADCPTDYCADDDECDMH